MIDTPPGPGFDSPTVNLPKEFEAVVRARRSVRKFESTPIPEEVVKKCLELALLAPTSSNLQCWEFYWIKNPEVRKEIDIAFLSQPAATTAPTMIIAVGRTKTWDRNRKLMLELFEKTEGIPESAKDYYKKIVPVAYSNGPLGIIGLIKRIIVTVVGIKKPIPREPVSESQMITWAAKTTALACENLMLAFASFGYDSCPMEGLDSKRVSKLLDLPRDAKVVMGISAGKRAVGGLYGPQIRFDSSLFIKKI